MGRQASRTPPAEHTASGLFVQLGIEDVSGAEQQIPLQNAAGFVTPPEPLPN